MFTIQIKYNNKNFLGWEHLCLFQNTFVLLLVFFMDLGFHK